MREQNGTIPIPTRLWSDDCVDGDLTPNQRQNLSHQQPSMTMTLIYLVIAWGFGFLTAKVWP